MDYDLIFGKCSQASDQVFKNARSAIAIHLCFIGKGSQCDATAVLYPIKYVYDVNWRWRESERLAGSLPLRYAAAC